MTIDTQPIEQRGAPQPNVEQNERYAKLAERVQNYGATEATRGRNFGDDYAASRNYGNKFDLAVALIRSDWYPDPLFLLDNFASSQEAPSKIMEARKNAIKLEIINSGKVDFATDTQQQKKLEGGVEQYVQDDEMLSELANSLPIGVMGAITTVLLFSDITDKELMEKGRSFATKSLLKPYLKDTLVRKQTGDINFGALVEKLPDRVFEDSESATYTIIKNFFIKNALSWFVKGEAEGFTKLEEFTFSLPPGKKRSFYEGIWYDLLATKDFKVPDNFIDTLPGFKPDQIVSFPSFRQKQFARKFKETRRDYLNAKTGAGKTSSSFLAMESVDTKKVVIFGPSRARNTWSREANKIFKDGDNKPTVFCAESMQDLRKADATDAKYLYVSTDLFPHAKPGTKAYEELKTLLVTTRGTDGIILDEAHICQNPNSDRAQMLKTLTREIEAGYASQTPFELPMLHLSATPIADDLDDLDVSMALLYPNKFAFPKEDTDEKVSFKKHTRNYPQLAHSLLHGENLMTQWSLAEMFGEDIPRLEYNVNKIQMSQEHRVIYEWLSEIVTDASELIRLEKDMLLNPQLIKKAVRKGNHFPVEGIPPRADLLHTLQGYYDSWNEWTVEKEASIPDMQFGGNWIAQYGDPNFILQCFFSQEFSTSVDGLIKSTPTIDRNDCEFRTTESAKFTYLKEKILQNLADGKKTYIVSPHRTEGVTDSFNDFDLLKKEEIDEEAILNSLFTHIDEEWMSKYPKDARVSIDGQRMKAFKDREEAARVWRESGTKNLVMLSSMESMYESIDLSIKKTDDNENITGTEVYFLSWPWGWDDFEQMCGRFIRPGVSKPFNIQVLEVEDTIDQGLFDTVRLKQLLQEIVLSGIQLNPEDEEFFNSVYSTNGGIRTERTRGQLFKRDVLSKLMNAREEDIMSQLSRMADGKSGFERFAEAFYDEGKDMFRASAFNTEIAKNILVENGPENILSLGAGTCILGRKILADKYPGVVDSVDINPFGLTMAKEAFPDMSGSFLQGKISDLSSLRRIDGEEGADEYHSIADNSYDAAECTFTLQWTNNRQVTDKGITVPPGDIQRVKALCEMNRVVKPGGRVVVSFPKNSLDEEHFATFTKCLEANFGFQVVTNRSGFSRATDIGRDIGWIITMVKVDRPNMEGLNADSLNLVSDATSVISRYKEGSEKKPKNVVSTDSQALYSPNEFSVINPLTDEAYDAKSYKEKAREEAPIAPNIPTLKEMKYSLVKGSKQWRAWHELRKTAQRDLGFSYQDAEDALYKTVSLLSLNQPNTWDENNLGHIKDKIEEEMLKYAF